MVPQSPIATVGHPSHHVSVSRLYWNTIFAIDVIAAVGLAKQMTSRKLLQISACASLIAFVISARADVRLTALFTDNMVLQQEMRAPVWGWADEGEEVTVRFRGKT